MEPTINAQTTTACIDHIATFRRTSSIFACEHHIQGSFCATNFLCVATKKLTTNMKSFWCELPVLVQLNQSDAFRPPYISDTWIVQFLKSCSSRLQKHAFNAPSTQFLQASWSSLNLFGDTHLRQVELKYVGNQPAVVVNFGKQDSCITVSIFMRYANADVDIPMFEQVFENFDNVQTFELTMEHALVLAQNICPLSLHVIPSPPSILHCDELLSALCSNHSRSLRELSAGIVGWLRSENQFQASSKSNWWNWLKDLTPFRNCF